MSAIINKEAALSAIPDNWLDDLLTGKNAPKLPWNCPEIERLLKGVRARIQALPAAHSRAQLASVIDEVAAERKRQIESEGWSAEHDAEHDGFELSRAAACYALQAGQDVTGSFRNLPGSFIRNLWPWDAGWWKPTSRRRNLVKAAALIVAEIERIDRTVLSRATDGEG